MLERAYGALHPGLYRYNSPTDIVAHFADLRQRLSASQSMSDAYLAFARVTAAVRCGHSYPNFYNQSIAMQATLFDRRDRLPFLFRWVGEQMIVTRDLSDAALPPGSKIRRIEGVDASRLLQSLMPLARADGHNDAKRRRILEVDGIDRYAAFDIYMPMRWPALVARGSVRVDVIRPDGITQRCDMQLLTATQRRAAVSPIGERPQNTVLWSFESKPGGIDCLTMPTWSVYNGTWDWRTWLESRLDVIASDGTRALIIDIRGNEGGLDCGEPIVARLLDRDVAPIHLSRRVRARRVPDDLRPHLDTWDKDFYDWGKKATGPRADGFYDLAEHDGNAKIVPANKRFPGNVIVLTDANNSSATFGFVQTLKANRLAIIVGEPTGGNRRGINGGAFLFLRLPTSGIEIDIPLIGYFPAGPQPDAGIDPDVLAGSNASDIAAGLDRAMHTAVRMAGSLA